MADAKKKATVSKKKKQYHPVKKFFSVFLIMIACFLTYMSAKEVITTVQLRQDIQQTQQEIKELQDQQAKLEDQKTKFEDEEYVKRYARGKYLMSKENETIYKVNNQEDTTENSEDSGE